MIRRATHADHLHICRLTKRFNDQFYDRPLNITKTADAVSLIIDGGACFVSDGGFIGGIETPDLFRDEVALIELGWYAEDRHGMRLLDTFIQEGKDRGVDEVRMCTMHTSPKSAVRALERRGFLATETSYRLRP